MIATSEGPSGGEAVPSAAAVVPGTLSGLSAGADSQVTEGGTWRPIVPWGNVKAIGWSVRLSSRAPAQPGYALVPAIEGD